MTRFFVAEEDRGPTVPESQIDLDAYATLAARVIDRAIADLSTKLYRASARRFLMYGCRNTIWAEYLNVHARHFQRLVVTDGPEDSARFGLILRDDRPALAARKKSGGGGKVEGCAFELRVVAALAIFDEHGPDLFLEKLDLLRSLRERYGA